MPSVLPAHSFIALALIVLLALCGAHAKESGAHVIRSSGSLENSGLVIHPGDVLSQDVIIDSFDPVDEQDAFEEYLVSRRLLQCRKCKCLPRCSRCLVMSCEDGLCTGFCKLPSNTSNCEIFRCSRAQEANTV